MTAEVSRQAEEAAKFSAPRLLIRKEGFQRRRTARSSWLEMYPFQSRANCPAALL